MKSIQIICYTGLETENGVESRGQTLEENKNEDAANIFTRSKINGESYFYNTASTLVLVKIWYKRNRCNQHGD